jgi:hypothetical protein
MTNTYQCNECGMAVKATCANCDVPLENGLLDLSNGKQIQVSICQYVKVKLNHLSVVEEI